MVIGGHVVRKTAHGIRQRVVADIDHEVDIIAADGLAEDSLCLTGAESRHIRRDDIGASRISVEFSDLASCQSAASPPADEVVIYFFAERSTALQRNNTQTTNRFSFIILEFVVSHFRFLLTFAVSEDRFRTGVSVYRNPSYGKLSSLRTIHGIRRATDWSI